MGMLDGLLGQVIGGALGGGGNASAANNPLGSILGGGSRAGAGSSGLGGAAGGMILVAVMAMLQKQGGVGAVLGKLRDSGLGAHADSWVGTGANIPVSGDDLHKALGGSAISDLAAKLGIPAQQAGGVLSKVLPELVNQLTPQGQLPDNHGDLLSQGLDILKGLGHH